eukprot:SAG31_NODE_4447_length_3223_cov_2.050576_1_plen_113_part_00
MFATKNAGALFHAFCHRDDVPRIIAADRIGLFDQNIHRQWVPSTANAQDSPDPTDAAILAISQRWQDTVSSAGAVVSLGQTRVCPARRQQVRFLVPCFDSVCASVCRHQLSS